MGGMFTILKVRAGLTNYNDPGWYDNPPGTVASEATSEDLKTDLGLAAGSSEADASMSEHHQHHTNRQ